jgi:hypothetical protein
MQAVCDSNIKQSRGYSLVDNDTRRGVDNVKILGKTNHQNKTFAVGLQLFNLRWEFAGAWWLHDGNCMDFFGANPSVRSTLIAARQAFFDAFNGNPPATELRIVKEADTGEELAVAVIDSSRNAEETARGLEVFLNSWGYEHLEDADYKLVFMPGAHGI